VQLTRSEIERFANLPHTLHHGKLLPEPSLPLLLATTHDSRCFSLRLSFGLVRAEGHPRFLYIKHACDERSTVTPGCRTRDGRDSSVCAQLHNGVDSAIRG